MDKPLVFSSEWFHHHRAAICRVLNAPVVGRIARAALRLPHHDLVVDVRPDGVTQWLGGETYRLTAFTGPTVARRLYRLGYPAWRLAHAFDMRVANRLRPAWNLGFDTLADQYPQAGSGGANVTCDGRVGRAQGGETWAQIRGGNGQSAADTGAADNIRLRTVGESADRFTYLDRGIFTFDISGVGSGKTVTAAHLHLYATAKYNGLGDAGLDIAEAQPAANNALAVGDYQTCQSTQFATRAYADMATGSGSRATNEFAFNASGLTYLTSKVAGVAALCGRVSWDRADSFGGTWTADGVSGYELAFADEAGTSYDPMLEVTYVAGGGASPKSDLMLLGVG